MPDHDSVVSLDLSSTIDSLSIVTVVFEAEYALLQLQARSFHAFLEDGVADEIVVIDNSRRGMSKRRRASLLAAYGRHRETVKIRRNVDIARIPPSFGWRSQQVLKIQVADQIGSDAYVVLDAKNHLISQVGRSTFVTLAGRPRANFHSYRSHPLKGSLESILDYFDLEKPKRVTRFTSTTTPFILITQASRLLVAALERREGQPFAEIFVRQRFTEFFLYAAWLESAGVRLDSIYDDSGIENSTIWPRERRHDDVLRILRTLRSDGGSFLSVHRTALARADYSTTMLIVSLWRECGLFVSVSAAWRFVCAYRLMYVISMGRKRLYELRFSSAS